MLSSQWQLKSPGQRPSRHHSTRCNPSNECLVKRARFPIEPSPCEPRSVRLDVFHLFPPITEFKVLIPKKNLQSASWSLKTEPIRFAKRSYCEVWVSSFCCDFVCAYYLRIWIYQRHILYILYAYRTPLWTRCLLFLFFSPVRAVRFTIDSYECQ